MERLIFLLPDAGTTRKVVDDLLLHRVEEKHMHVLAKRGLPLEGLPEARWRDKSDLVPAIERGVAAGGLTGLALGLVALAFPPVDLLVAGGALALATTLAGAGFGAWVSALVGASVPNSQLVQYQAAIDQGKLLLFVDVPYDRMEDIRGLVLQQHPEAQFCGEAPKLLPYEELSRH
jgi:hypothetical protein